jgi:hypothetical protein
MKQTPQYSDGWQAHELEFLKQNFYSLTNQQLTDYINQNRSASQQLTISFVRHKCYQLGLKRGTQIRWSHTDTQKLIAWYPLMGDKEIAYWLNKTNTTFRLVNGVKVYRRFNCKNIEKKRMLLKLERTADQLYRLRSDNALINAPVAHPKMWETRGAAKKYTIRIWNSRRYIKLDNGFEPYTRWFYNNYIAPLSVDDIVYHTDGNTLNDEPANLAIITRQELAKSNSIHRYPPELRNAMLILGKLNAKIKHYEKQTI